MLGAERGEPILFGLLATFRPSSEQILSNLEGIFAEGHCERYRVKRVAIVPVGRTCLGEPLLQHFAVFVDRLC